MSVEKVTDLWETDPEEAFRQSAKAQTPPGTRFVCMVRTDSDAYERTDTNVFRLIDNQQGGIGPKFLGWSAVYERFE